MARRGEPPSRMHERSIPVLIGESPALRGLRQAVQRAAATDAPVLVLGETGTGKSLLARLIHAGGGRSGGPFVAINCAALPEALFEKRPRSGQPESRGGRPQCGSGGARTRGWSPPGSPVVLPR